MDIVLQTNTADSTLTFANIEASGDGSEFVCRLEVTSGWLKASRIFYFGEVDVFLAELAALHASLKGVAQLKFHYEEETVKFTGDGLGRINVRVRLIDYNGQDQSATFGFRTDQTCLPSLISDFKALAATIAK